VPSSAEVVDVSGGAAQVGEAEPIAPRIPAQIGVAPAEAEPNVARVGATPAGEPVVPVAARGARS
jgi:hypothetical protein